MHFPGILRQIGVPLPHIAAWLTIGAELVGGLALLLGALVVWASITTAAVLLVAMVTVHLSYGFSSVKLLSVSASGAQFGPAGMKSICYTLPRLSPLRSRAQVLCRSTICGNEGPLQNAASNADKRQNHRKDGTQPNGGDMKSHKKTAMRSQTVVARWHSRLSPLTSTPRAYAQFDEASYRIALDRAIQDHLDEIVILTANGEEFFRPIGNLAEVATRVLRYSYYAKRIATPHQLHFASNKNFGNREYHIFFATSHSVSLASAEIHIRPDPLFNFNRARAGAECAPR